MIIVDNALGARGAGRPIRVGMIGAGFMGQGLTNQIVNSVPGMRMAAVYSRRRSGLDVFDTPACEMRRDRRPGASTTRSARMPGGHRGSVPDLPVRADRRVVDVTGSVEFGARVLSRRSAWQAGGRR